MTTSGFVGDAHCARGIATLSRLRCRRSGIESLNAEARTNRGMGLRRGLIRVLGAPRTHLLLAIALTGLNVRILRDWSIRRSLSDPWLRSLGDTSDPDWATLHRERPRRPRRLALHERLAHQDIPRRSDSTLRGSSAHRRQHTRPPRADDPPA